MVIIDTNILMHANRPEEIFEEFEDVSIPVEVLAELDHLKGQAGEKGMLARCGVRAIKKNMDKIDFLIHEDTTVLNRMSMIVDDIIIEHCKLHPEAILLTNDINMEIKANALGLKAQNFYGKERGEITPVHKILMTTADYNDFLVTHEYHELEKVLIGQFVAIYNSSTFEEMGTYRFLGKNMWDPVTMKDKIASYAFDVEPRDIHQACAIKSLKDDEFTIITGPAGTGKTLLSLGHCLELMSKEGATVNIFVNPVKTRDTEELGFYPGSRDEKLLSNFIGGILASKLGDISEAYRLISMGNLKLYPFSDIRGVEIGAGDVMYITEAQNLSIDLMKLAIQRCADGSKLIIEGDCCAQIDKQAFAGSNNGLQRAIDVFTGTDTCDFGYVTLPNIYRSKMASKAEDL